MGFSCTLLLFDMALVTLLKVYHSILCKDIHDSYLLDKVDAVTLMRG